MDTYDQMIVDNQYSGNFNSEKYLIPKQSDAQEETSNKDDDGNGLLGRRVYLESPSFGNKEEEDMYRYVSSRLTNYTGSLIDTTAPAPTDGATLTRSEDELDVLARTNNRSHLSNRRASNPINSKEQLSTTLTNIPRADPRQDPLLGPLLAELDSMYNQQQQHRQASLPPATPLSYRRNSLPYQSNIVRPTDSSNANHALSHIASRAVTDALFEAELYDTLDSKYQQQHQINPYTNSNLNIPNYSQPLQQQQQQQQPSIFTNMDNIDLYVPSSYSSDPNSFLNHFGPEDQLFQRPLLNSLVQNYVPNTRPLHPPSSQQHNISFDQPRTYLTPTQRTNYIRPQLSPNPLDSHQLPPSQPPLYSIPSNQQNRNFPNEYQQFSPQQRNAELNSHQRNPSNSQDVFFTDTKDDQFEQRSPNISQRSNDQLDQDSKRQAIWNELQRTSARTQEKNAKKPDTMNRGKGTFGSSSTWNSSNNQSPANQFKPPQRIIHQPPPIAKPNYSDEHFDMNKNKENFYRPPVKRFEKLNMPTENEKYEYEPKMMSLPSPPLNKPQRQTSLPVMVNLHTNENSRIGSVPGTISIPLDSHISQDGDKISLNIDLRLADLQNIRQQQQQQQRSPEHGHWSSFDPLEKHIRKLERNIDQSLPNTNPPQRSPVVPSTGINAAMGRHGKGSVGTNRSGYNPPVYGGDYDYSARSRDDDSYLSKLNETKKHPQFKPYTGRDYEQFKRNCGFGLSHIPSKFDNTTHKEKMDKLAKTKQYAQQIEARNKKIISDVSRRTYSDTRLPTETSKPSRLSAFSYASVFPKQHSATSIHSSPSVINGILPYIPARRPTDALYKPAVRLTQMMMPLHKEDNEHFDSLRLLQEEHSSPRTVTISPLQKKRELSVKSDNHRIENIGRQDKSLTRQRYSSSPTHLPVVRFTSNDTKRRPIKFDQSLIPNESNNLSSQQNNQRSNIV